MLTLIHTGFVGLVGKPAEKNGPEVEVLLQLGAVIYCKTNIPQALMVCYPNQTV